MITVHPMGRRYGLEVSTGDEKITLVFSQLNYFSRNKIASITTSYKKGGVFIDSSLSCFYNIKHALKEIYGVIDAEGNPYKLKFENDNEELTDECVDELLSTELSDALLYTAASISNNIPTQILNPITKLPIEGLEIIPPEKLKGTLEKK